MTHCVCYNCRRGFWTRRPTFERCKPCGRAARYSAYKRRRYWAFYGGKGEPNSLTIAPGISYTIGER